MTAYTIAVPNATDARFAVDYSAYRTSSVTLPVELVLENDPNVASDHTNACYGLSQADMVSWIENFVAETISITTPNPLIKTTAAWWNACTGGNTNLADPL